MYFMTSFSSAEKLLDCSPLQNPEVFPSSQVRCVPRHTVSPECPVPTAQKGFFRPGPHMHNFTKLARQFHPGHPTSLLIYKNSLLLSCTYRKKCLMCNNLLMIAAASIMGCSKIAQSFEMILIGRFMCGISAGKGFPSWVSRLSQNFTSLFKVNNKC